MAQPGAILKQRLKKGVVLAPGAYDALSARLAAQAGASAVYMTGFGVAGSLLGVPDIGLVGVTEMADRVRALAAAAAPAPLIADGDNGHGGPFNVERLVTLYAQAGAAAIQLEDQVIPKRCGHMEDKAVVPLAEAVAKIRAAVGARGASGPLIIARTDARAVEGMKAALKRGEAFLKAGADCLFIEAPQTMAELEQIARAFRGVALVANMVEDGKTPYLDAGTLGDLGFRLVLFPVSALLSVAAHLGDLYERLLAEGALPDDTRRLRFSEYNRLMGLDDILARGRDLAQDQARSPRRRRQ